MRRVEVEMLSLSTSESSALRRGTVLRLVAREAILSDRIHRLTFAVVPEHKRKKARRGVTGLEITMRSFATVAYEELSLEFDKARAERVHIVDVLTTFAESELSLSSASKIHDLLAELVGPRPVEATLHEQALLASLDALCGPKETPRPPSS